ncbi:MAG: DUF1636 domain-containing protein [Pseudomonadota bacterium]|nr:DUF1636 domain-containing protein [Pseudomonadota bacterium]
MIEATHIEAETSARNRLVLAVCAACSSQMAPESRDSAGKRLIDRLREQGDALGISVRAVPCFAVCDRPVTLAFMTAGKWSYVIGDVDPEIDLAEIVAAVDAVAAAPSGVPALSQRPDFFRKGVIARLPPIAAPVDGGDGSD